MNSACMLVRKTVTTEVPGLLDKIRDAHRQSGKSIEQVCRDAGISRQTWYNIENGFLKTGIDYGVLEKIEKALGVDFGVTFD
jgi:transcriptional regulator with XRE-family HTH domain